MSDENNNGRNPPPGGRQPLTLKPRGAGSVSAGTVKQSFSHGRSKTVVVETKRARTHLAGGGNLAAWDWRRAVRGNMGQPRALALTGRCAGRWTLSRTAYISTGG